MKEKRGVISVWFENKGYGFILVREGKRQEKFFVHISNITGEPSLGSCIDFNVNPVREGSLRAAIDAVVVTAEASNELR